MCQNPGRSNEWPSILNKSEHVVFDHVSFCYDSPTKSRGVRRDRVIIDDLTFTISAGDFFFLTGMSGSGKTTLLKLIFRDLVPTIGKIKVFDRDLSLVRHKELHLFRRKIGIVLQTSQLLDHMNLLENVSLPLIISDVPIKRAQECAHELLDWVGLKDCLALHPPSLSDGQKQRAIIARAVITNPYMLLADEPTANVDETQAYKIMHLFEELNKNGTTVILATHHRQLIDCYKHPELYLHKGKLIQTSGNQAYAV